MLTKTTRLAATGTLFFFTMMCVHCNNSGAGDALIRVTAPGKQAEQVKGGYDQVVGPLLADLPQFLADGTSTVDPAAILEATESIFAAASGTTLVLRREGASLRVAGSNDSPFEVSWSEDLSTMQVTTPDGLATIELVNVKAEDRHKAVARLALSVLSLGQQPLETTDADPPYVAPIVIIVAIVFGTWVACVTLGTLACAAACAYKCSATGVMRSSMNCTVPDANNGYLCTCDCWPPSGGT
jgi:hypothetical protein